MMKFRTLQLEDRAWIEHCRSVEITPFSALSFPSLYMWSKEYGLTISGDDDYFVIHSKENNVFFVPCGKKEKCEAFLEDTFRREGRLRVIFLTREQADEARAKGYHVKESPELSEYICSTRALAELEGHVSTTYRKKTARFSKEHPYEVRCIIEEDIPQLLAFLTAWEEEREKTGDLDLAAARFALENFSNLGLCGIILHTEDHHTAFSFGFKDGPDVYDMAVVKYDKCLPPSVTFVCTKEEARLAASQCTFCNLEEDLGLKGLRDSKLQCSPVKIQEVFTLERE